ncbi:Xanthine dehydrogenase/oxidase, partial [Trichoplax sp. H2]
NDLDCKLYKLSDLMDYDPSQDIIFPPELLLLKDKSTTSLEIHGKNITWFRPCSLDELLSLKRDYPKAKLVIGNTEIGIEMKFKDLKYSVLISPSEIPSLNVVKHSDEGIEIGGCVSLTKMNKILCDAIEKLPEYKTRIFAAIVEMLRWFAGHQTRNVGVDERKVITMDESFFAGYRKTCLDDDEIVISILIPFTSKNEYFLGFKQARRRSDDISIVNAGMRVVVEKSLSQSNYLIKDCTLSFGGMAPVTVIAQRASHFLTGREWNKNLTELIIPLLNEDMPLAFSTPGGMVEYRKALVCSFFFKFYLTVTSQLLPSENFIEAEIPPSYLSATSVFKKDPTRSIQVFEKPDSNQAQDDALRRPMVHTSALKQTTGEAVYCDDMPTFSNELFAGLVLSQRPHAIIESVDYKDALSMPGVHSHVTAKDVKGSNLFGVIQADEEIFATKEVTCVGQLIGVILADTKEHANEAAKAVHVVYEDLPAILTIERAIQADSYYPYDKQFNVEGIEKEIEKSDHVLEGDIRIGGQEHFYLEPQSCVALPKLESGEMEIFVTSQGSFFIQESICKALDIPFNRVIIRIKRLGGGFGGKESRTIIIALAASIGAQRNANAVYRIVSSKRPVRCVLDRDVDMSITGTRHPYLFKYKVGFGSTGIINALRLRMYANCGNSLDLSPAVMSRTLLTCSSCYRIPHFDISPYLCKTNIPSNTAFRGFGSPQGVFAIETILTEIAINCGITQLQVREINLYKDGDITHYGDVIEESRVRTVLNEVIKSSNFHKRKVDVESYNRENRWKKRGISVIPLSYPVGFNIRFMNQGGALVIIYLDGSVLLSHGGIEMGQGLHTKMTQICSHILGVPTDKIYLIETNSSNIPNATQTAASSSTDLNGAAIANACEKLRNRIKPFQEANPKGKWEDWVKAAYLNRVNLSANGFYSCPAYDDSKTYLYRTYGAAVSEVEIDTLTGDFHILRTDIVMDVGKSLNPAVDIGQIEGGFIQGVGLYTLEDHIFSPTGYLLTRGPGTYKIPSSTDIPNEFYVYLLPKVPNKYAIYSSKGIGEPPLLLGSSVFFAIKDAIIAARQDADISNIFRFDSPATCERIRMMCNDEITALIKPSTRKDDEKPWMIRV